MTPDRQAQRMKHEFLHFTTTLLSLSMVISLCERPLQGMLLLVLPQLNLYLYCIVLYSIVLEHEKLHGITSIVLYPFIDFSLVIAALLFFFQLEI